MFTKPSKEGFSSTFDQTALEINFQHGKTQLQEIKISYNWIGGKLKSRLPVLHCQWFNKTEESMDLIEEVSEDSYQPSIMDVGKMIYIQIIPESKDMEYIGMPITKFIGPLVLAPSTDQQVNELIQAQKSTFFVECLKFQLKTNDKKSEITAKDTLLKVIKNKLVLIGKKNGLEKSETILSTTITKQYPKAVISRKISKQITLYFNQHQKVTILFQGNKIRDVFCLLIQKIEENAEEYVQTEIKQDENIDFMSQTSIGKEIKLKSQENLVKSQKSLERLPLSPQSQDLPKEKEKEDNKEEKCKEDLREVSHLTVGNSQLLNIIQNFELVKEKLKQQSKFSKELNSKLQNQIKALLVENTKLQEEACYHKNESKLLKQDLIIEQNKSNNLSKTIEQLQKKTSISMSEISVKEHYSNYLNMTFQELLEELIVKKQQLQELKYKNMYQTERLESVQNDVKTLNEQIQNNQDMIKQLQKRIESLNESKKSISDHILATNTRSHQIGQYQFQIGKLKEEIIIVKESSRLDNENKEKQIQSLKIQVKELIEENTYLRSKEKSSKGELKNEIVELKKLVNRFAESISEKDMQIEQLKLTNKQLSKSIVRIVPEES